MSHVRLQQRGFTLLEVLVVVAIIALLIGVLLPSLNRARQLARSTSCKGSIRQLGVGMTMYLQQYHCYPAHQWILEKNGSELRIRWFHAMSRLVGGFEVQACPTTPEWDVGRNNSYGYNYKYLGSGRDNLKSPTAPWERFPVKTLKAPSDTIAFGDSDGTGWKKPYQKNINDKDMFGNHGYTLDPTYIPVVSEYTTSAGARERYAWCNFRTYISTRHQGGANLCFADGHVSPLKPKQVYKNNKYWNGLGAEDPTRDPHVTYRYWTGGDDDGKGTPEWRFPDI